MIIYHNILVTVPTIIVSFFYLIITLPNTLKFPNNSTHTLCLVVIYTYAHSLLFIIFGFFFVRTPVEGLYRQFILLMIPSTLFAPI